MDAKTKIIDTFRSEAEDYLTEIEDVLFDIEQAPDDVDNLNRLFRIVHNLKGAGAMFGFDSIASFAHYLETTLEWVREGDVKADKTLIDLVFASRDYIKKLLDDPETGKVDQEEGERLIERLKALAPENELISNFHMKLSENDKGADFEGEEFMDFRIRFSPNKNIYFNGADPANFLDDLRTLGNCVATMNVDNVPDLKELSPEMNHLTWDISLTTQQDRDAVQDVFIFLDADEYDIQESKAFSPKSVSKNVERQAKEDTDYDEVVVEDDKLLREFIVEAKEHLKNIEDDFLKLKESVDTVEPELINKVFRAIHSIKGAAGFLNLLKISKLAHSMGTLLFMMKNGEIKPEKRYIEALLPGVDLLNSMIDDAKSSNKVNIVETQREIDNLIRGVSSEVASAMDHTVDIPAEDGEAPFMVDELCYKTLHQKDEFLYVLSYELIQFEKEKGFTPKKLVNELVNMGTIIESRIVSPKVKLTDPIDKMDLKVEFIYSTDIDPSLISDAAHLSMDFIKQVDESDVIKKEREKPSTAPIYSAAEDETSAAPTLKSHDVQLSANETVRVPSSRLDSLINLVGEMVISQARLSAAVLDDEQNRKDELENAVEEMERLISELRDNVLTIRMMPIGGTFSRFKRLVRDLASDLGKKVIMVTKGAETELDKTVLDRLADPLVHLIRNSIDHGLETPEARIAAGKPETGIVKLSATHKGAHVMVSIQDDGRGLDVDAIRSKAVERGLMDTNAELSEHDTFQMIFAPGFSTAKVVSNVSGRGVGMDVVKRQIESLRGSVDITSEKGKGTTVSLTLPLTLAIIDGLLVKILEDRYIIPLSAVTETVEITKAERAARNARNLVVVRGEQIPYVRLRDLFRIEGEEPDIENVVIVEIEDKRLGLVVDKVLGNHQTVIKSLGQLYKDVEVVSGATIMGDGLIALILDIVGVVRHKELLDKL